MIRLAMSMAALVLGTGVAMAAEDAAQRAQRCAGVADSLERLVCYDRVFAPGRAAAGAGATAPAPAAPAAAPAPAATPPVASAPAPAQAPAARQGEGAGFGSDQLRRLPSEAAEDPRSLTAKVQELRETRPNVFRIALDNGQVWQQMDMDSLFHVEVGDSVEITRGRLGGYRMARQTRGGSGWVRVNRIK